MKDGESWKRGRLRRLPPLLHTKLKESNSKGFNDQYLFCTVEGAHELSINQMDEPSTVS